MVLTVPEAARIAQRNPETIRRWIREGKLSATRVGTQYIVQETDIAAVGKGSPHRVQEAALPYAVASPAQARSSVDPWLTAIVGRLVHGFDPARIVLFGRRARGEARPDSDYELLVVLDEVPDRRAARLELRRALDDLPISKEILAASIHDLEDKGPATWGPIGWAMSEGQTLYERP
jgi:excisionase family DNA binding protein